MTIITEEKKKQFFRGIQKLTVLRNSTNEKLAFITAKCHPKFIQSFKKMF